MTSSIEAPYSGKIYGFKPLKLRINFRRMPLAAYIVCTNNHYPLLPIPVHSGRLFTQTNCLSPGFRPDLAEEAHDASQMFGLLGSKPVSKFPSLSKPLERVRLRKFKYIRAKADKASFMGVVAIV